MKAIAIFLWETVCTIAIIAAATLMVFEAYKGNYAAAAFCGVVGLILRGTQVHPQEMDATQFDSLNSKLIWIQEQMAQARREYDKRIKENDERWERLEKKLGSLENTIVFWAGATKGLCERLDALTKKVDQRITIDYEEMVRLAIIARNKELLLEEFKRRQPGKQKAERGKTKVKRLRNG